MRRCDLANANFDCLLHKQIQRLNGCRLERPQTLDTQDKAFDAEVRKLAQCRIAGHQIIEGKVTDPAGGATHYYAATMVKAPDWATKATRTLRLGNHIFFKNVP